MILNTGAEMSMIGLGTWNAEKVGVGKAIHRALIQCDYRHIDCAHVYENEVEIGESLHEIFQSGSLKREDVFITSKLWNDSHAKNDVVVACKKTLHDLHLDYLDLYLMHFGISSPLGAGFEPLNEDGVLVTTNVSLRETWEAMEELVKLGLVKAIGVSNFTGPMLVDLLTYANIIPAINQIELHPYNQQTKFIEFCRYHGIEVTAYSPLGSSDEVKKAHLVLLEDKTIKGIAQDHAKTPAQILIRWSIQRGTIVIPKSTNPERIQENINVFDFELTQTDMDRIATLDKRHRYVDPYDWWKIPYFD